jgi:hypothetical protein
VCCNSVAQCQHCNHERAAGLGQRRFRFQYNSKIKSSRVTLRRACVPDKRACAVICRKVARMVQNIAL